MFAHTPAGYRLDLAKRTVWSTHPFRCAAKSPTAIFLIVFAGLPFQVNNRIASSSAAPKQRVQPKLRLKKHDTQSEQ